MKFPYILFLFLVGSLQAAMIERGKSAIIDGDLEIRTREFEGKELLEVFYRKDSKKKGSILTLEVTDEKNTIDNWPSSPYFTTVAVNKKTGVTTIVISREDEKGRLFEWRITRVGQLKYEMIEK